MPDLFVAELAFELRHVFFGAVVNAGKDFRGRGPMRPGIGIGEIGRRRPGIITAAESLSVLIVTFGTMDEIELLALGNRLTSIGKRFFRGVAFRRSGVLSGDGYG
jgi:hypothetical protein